MRCAVIDAVSISIKMQMESVLSVHLVLMAWTVMQPAYPGILGICVGLCATVPPISVTESMAVRTIRKKKHKSFPPPQLKAQTSG